MKDHHVSLLIKKVFIYGILIFLSALSIIPICLVMVNVTRSTPEINAGLTLVPSVHLFDNWKSLNSIDMKISNGFRNSFLVALPSALCAVYFSAMTAYGLHMYRFRGRRLLWSIILFFMMLPATLSFIGFYQSMVRLGLRNSYLPLIIPSIAAPVTVFFLRQYLSSIPARELAEVSRIDGASEFRIFNEIVLPIMGPALSTQAFFAFLASWNNFLAPVVLISDVKLYTLPMMVMQLQASIHNPDYGSMDLGVAVSTLPIVFVYSFCSRYIISGLTAGSIKE